jgi:zinc and cadmium transporter
MLFWIILLGLAMSCIALVGSVTLLFSERTLQRLLLPLVAFAAGSLIGGALFHMIPSAVSELGNSVNLYIWIAAGFLLFLALEQFLNWHHSHSQSPQERAPLTYLILVADALHNFIGGLFVTASLLVDLRLGLVAWLAAAAHEIPQELGDFGVLLHGGWSKSKALIYNFCSALTFLAGGLVAYAASGTLNVAWLIPFAAGNFLYIGAADLIPEIKKTHDWKTNLLHFTAFTCGGGILLLLRLVSPGAL